MEIDPNGPPPMNYHDRMEWLSLREGRPINVPGSSTNALPNDYHERMESLRFYASQGRDGKSHRGTTVRHS